MTFEETLAQVVEVLRRERRVSYRALRRRFGLDEEYLADLKVEIIQAKQLATDEDDTILVWTGEATPTSVSTLERPPLTYTPAHLSEKIRLFAIIEADLKSFHTRLICAFVGCVHFADHTPSVGST